MADDLADMWKKAMEDAPDLPENGAGPPQAELFQRAPLKDGESPVVLQKIVTEVYVYTSVKTGDMWYGSKSFQDVQVVGHMTLGEALKIIDARKNKKRR